MNRRSFIKLGALPLISPAILNAVENKKDEKAVLFIWLGGGISSVEFTNPVSDGIDKYRSVNGVINTKSGFQLGADFPLLAGISDKITTVKSLRHQDGNHNSATSWMLSSHSNFAGGENAPQKEPSYGSLVSKYFDPNTKIGLPTYVKLNRIHHDGPAWLGSTYLGYDLDEGSSQNLIVKDKNVFSRRLQMVNTLETKKDGLYKDWSDLRNQAANIVVGSAGEAFDLSKEPIENQNLYKVNQSGFGKSLLTARRLIQAGCKFMTVQHGGWDMHTDISKGFKDRAPETDYMISTCISDLEKHGLLDKTLIVISSEFSRTMMNAQFGKDHLPTNVALMFAGGRYNHGQCIGQTSKDGLVAMDNIFGPQDLSWTIGNFLGIPKDYTLIDNMRRPRHIFENEAKLIIS